MIILAAVIILSLSGSGIIGNAKDARDKSNDSNLKDAAVVAYSEYRTAKALGKTTKTAEAYIAGVLGDAGYTPSEIARVNINNGVIKVAKIVDGVIIPDGFTASIYAGENTVARGLVIYKTDAATLKTKSQSEAQTMYDQFVWIPVTYTAKGDSDGDGFDEGFEDKFRTKTWNTSFGSDHFEPNVNGYPGEVEEYNVMKKSVQKYGGFWIARYEAGDGEAEEARTGLTDAHEVVIRKNAYAYNYVIWGDSMTDIGTKGAVYLSQTMYQAENKNYITHLPYGVQYDAIFNWISDEKDVETVEGSKLWGNYDTNSQTCGSNETWKAKNIYDLSGNAWEMTMESTSIGERISRGGKKYSNGTVVAASWRSVSDDIFGDGIGTAGPRFRPVLYLK